MKKIFGYIVLIASLTLIPLFNSSAVEQEEEIIDTGAIIEIAADDHIIQVKNRNYIVTAVFVDDGTRTELEPGFFRDLKVGSIVTIYVNGKSNGFWKAKKVILFTGEKEKEVLKSME